MSTMTSAQEVYSEMDRLTQLGTPYLFIVDYEQQNGWVIAHAMEQHQIYFRIKGITNVDGHAVKCASAAPAQGCSTFHKKPLTFAQYKAKFDVIRAALLRGDSFLANLTVATPIETNLSLEQIFARATAPYCLYVPNRFVCFSPEPFIHISSSKRIGTYPMKGTIKADVPHAEETILNDYKETCEHYTVVDLLRSDLARVATNVEVTRFRYVDQVDTKTGPILQVSSAIEADLLPAYCNAYGTLLQQLLPAGSITGAPKPATVQAIANAECQPRGFYTGVFGYFDGAELQSAVMIRFIEQRADGELLFRSGGGVTINSKVEEEYAEVLEKVYLPFVE